MKRLMLLVLVAGLLYIPGANAGHDTAGSSSYTGCLITRGDGKGKIIKVKLGEQPLRSCTSRQREIHLSGGDITQVTAGTGLGGGGSSGATTLDLAPTYRLPQSCATTQVARWDGDSWECSDPTTIVPFAFRAVGNTGQLESTEGTHVVELPTEVFDTADGYDPVTSSFTVPGDGVYHFDFRTTVGSVSALSTDLPHIVTASVRRNETAACTSKPVPKAEAIDQGLVFFNESPCLVDLDDGDVIDLVVFLSSGAETLDVQIGGILSGFRV